jgi:hypothetical protein
MAADPMRPFECDWVWGGADSDYSNAVAFNLDRLPTKVSLDSDHAVPPQSSAWLNGAIMLHCADR